MAFAYRKIRRRSLKKVEMKLFATPDFSNMPRRGIPSEILLANRHRSA